MAVALRMLSRRAVSEGEVRRRLIEKGVPESEAGPVLSRLTELGLLDDRRLCEGLVRTFRESRRYGRAKILASLSRRFVPREIAESVLGEVSSGDEELETAAQALRRKYLDGIPAGREGAAKAFRFLASRGFPFEICRRALGRAISETDTEEGE